MSYQHPSAKIPYDLDIWVVSLPSNRGKWRFSSGSPSLKMVPRDHDFDHMMQEAQEDLLSVSKFFGGPCDLWYIQKRTNTSLIHVVFFDIFCKYFLFDYTSIICIIFVYTSDLFIILQRCWMFFFCLEGRSPDFYFMNFQLQLRCWGRTTCISTSWTVELRVFHGENGGGPSGWYPSRLTPFKEPFKRGYIPNKY